MPERIDHVIVAAADLDHLETTFRKLGFQVVGGGQHPHLGTRNRIILLDQGYIELLAIADEQSASPAVRERVARTPGWIGFALQSTEIAREASDMRERGADIRGPKPGKLVAPSGRTRSWQTVSVGSDDLFSVAEPTPFLIQHDSSGTQHQQELAGADSIEPHPNGAQRLLSVIVAVANLADAAQAYGQMYGFSSLSAPSTFSVFGAATLSLPFDRVDEQIILAQPQQPGFVADRLMTAGEGVCGVVVAVDNRATTQSYLEGKGVNFESGTDDWLVVSAVVTGGAPLLFAGVMDVH
jgi:hypothetical protein